MLYDLSSIDLTQNKRFARAANNAEASFISVSHANSEDIKRRLKRGEIPHKNNNFELSSIEWKNSSFDITYTNSTNFSDWLYTGPTTITSIQLSQLSNDSRIDIDINDFSATSIIWSTYNSTTDSFNYYKPHEDDCISRFKYDPFDDFQYTDALYRVKDKTHKPNSKSDILKRFQFANFIDNISSTIFRRMSEIDNDDNENKFHLFSLDKTTNNLKAKAPFIKRVYVTNGGRSFDNTELKFDLVLAEEHFDECLQLLH
jgi:hypothetical protein